MTGKTWLGSVGGVLDDEGAVGRVHVCGRAAKGNCRLWRDASPADCSLAVFGKRCGRQRRMSCQGPPKMDGVTVRHRRKSTFFSHLVSCNSIFDTSCHLSSVCI